MRSKSNKFRKTLGYLANQFKYQFVGSFTTAFAIVNHPSPANAQLFKSAQSAMKCIVDQAKTGNTTGAIFTNLPVIIFTALTLVIFGYFLYTIATAISAYGNGQEVTHVIQQPLITFIFVVLIMVFQNLMFGSGGCSAGTTN
ncbi:hypothetical protein [Mastigocoleus sp. MO_188.B34]|uniref:hypothetical protein n=1 Tax=Mastigocoleus sp. MO_188.B34 TaxID=3036635 RepID=UPI002616514F|nr:hypothetical protein [Mastigocoleus sp. MO_188.B34]MDJ0696938.1 hypothetical protein [Mastigocoleus sp. MO_188.B34]